MAGAPSEAGAFWPSRCCRSGMARTARSPAPPPRPAQSRPRHLTDPARQRRPPGVRACARPGGTGDAKAPPASRRTPAASAASRNRSRCGPRRRLLTFWQRAAGHRRTRSPLVSRCAAASQRPQQRVLFRAGSLQLRHRAAELWHARTTSQQASTEAQISDIDAARVDRKIRLFATPNGGSRAFSLILCVTHRDAVYGRRPSLTTWRQSLSGASRACDAQCFTVSRDLAAAADSERPR